MNGSRHGFRNRIFQIFVLFVLLIAGSRGLQAQATPQQPGPGVGEKSTPIHAVPEKRKQEEDENAAFLHSKAVQKLGALVGMNPGQAATAFEVLNFLILAVAVGFFSLKTLPKKFRERNSTIQKHLVDARTATEEARARLTSVEDRLGRLDAEIAGMRRQVEAEIVREEQRIRESMDAETAKILASADTEIQAATAAARRELQRQAAELAIQHASQRLVVTAETDRLLVQSLAQRLMGEKGGQN